VQKAKLSTIELIFVLIAALTIFFVTFQQLSADGVLPGNDPAVHLIKAKQIITDQRVSYSEIAWYPPLFHTLLAMMQLFAGTLDIMVAALLLKLFVATLNVLLLLCTYLIARKIFNIPVAVASTVFTFMSVPLFEIMYWGGYPNYLGFAYIALIFYVMLKDFKVKTKLFLLFFDVFFLGLTHQLSMFVFVLMFIPTFLASTTGGSKKNLLIFFAMIIGGGLALLVWYARVIIEYADIMIQYIFYSISENYYYIGSVAFYGLNKNLATTLYLTAVGIPLILLLIKLKKVPKSALMVIFWLAVPFILSQSYLLGVSLPYHRFVYFFATPIAIISGVTIFCVLQLPELVKTKLLPKLPRKRETLLGVKLIAVALIIVLFASQASVFLQRVGPYPTFYERASTASYDSGIWVNQYSTVNDSVVVPRSPGSWFNVFSDRITIEETDPLYSRNVVAEAVLYSFYEMENSRTLTQEYNQQNINAGQELDVSVYNVWTKIVTIPTKDVNVVYLNSTRDWVELPLLEANETIYWTKQSAETSQLVCEYVHEYYNVQKIVTFQNNSSAINIEWKLIAQKDLPHARLTLGTYFEPSLDFKEALIPGILQWENPWVKPTKIAPDNGWAIVEDVATHLRGNVAAVLDPTNRILAVVEFNQKPSIYSIGALTNRFIDALRLTYDFGNLTVGEKAQISFKILLYAFQAQTVERLDATELMQQYDTKTVLPVKQRDYLTYINEYNIKFVAVDTQQVPSNRPATPDLDRVYDNGRAVVYATKK
jgi:hypothetical protein